jgi:hypothetical protein
MHSIIDLSLIFSIIYPFSHNLHYVRCGKKDRKFPSQITDAVDHNRPVTENSGIKFPTSLSDCSAIYIGIFFRNTYISELRCVKF